MLAATSTSALGDETVYPVHPHDIAIVQGGGGFVQKVPFNIPGFGTLGLTEDDKNKLAQQVKDASTSFMTFDVKNILAAIADANDRSDVALKAIALGGDAATINSALSSIQGDVQFAKAFQVSKPVAIFWGIASTASMAASAYHGYKRNDSIGWALWWGFMGALFPIITPTIALAQGFGQPRRAGFGRRHRGRRHHVKHYRRKAA